MPAGIIIKGIGGFYYVKIAETVFECKARGLFRKDAITPLPGDMVNISVIDESKKTGYIEEILPRHSQLVRPAVANVNQLGVVIAVKSPDPDFILVDKLLVTAGFKGLDSFICINKIDLDADEEYKKIIRAYEKAGYRYVLLSSKRDVGFGDLKCFLRNRITVLAGQSGVGKSTILNRILNTWIMDTGEISDKIKRGRHTTRHAELVELEEGGYIVDTPGFSNLELLEIECRELESLFPEFGSYRDKCRFSGCSHINEPDCGVKDALEKDLIDIGRYRRYVEFYNSIKQVREYKKK